jgi:dTDP-4-dehydrorhamnose reductase
MSVSVTAGRIVITGAGGQVGAALSAASARQGRDVLALTSAQWDITDADTAKSTIDRDDVVINCAAYTDVDGAESDEQAAYAVNAVGPELLARACAQAGARLVHISTDYVFSGNFDRSSPRPYEPGDPAEPLSVYGRSKRAGELAVLAASPEATVVRTAWVYTGFGGTDFVAVMRRLAAGSGTVEVVDDQTGSPTYAMDLAEALLQVADRRVRSRLMHAANSGAVTRFELARAVFEGTGADPQRVRPVDSARHRRPARRPAYSALSSRQSVEAGLSPMRPWRDALAEALRAGPLPSTRE